MKHSVVLVSREGMEGWFGETVLRRSDIEVQHTGDCRSALHLILRSHCRLVIAEEWEGCPTFQVLLSELLFSIRKDDFRVILLTNSMSPGPASPPIAGVFPVPCDRDAFDRCIVDHLGLRPRAGKRRLVRLYVNASSRDEMSMGMAVCLVLNPAGMVVEASSALPLGKTFFWSFQGIPQLKGLRVAGRILRPTAPEGGAKGHCFAVGFDEDALQERTLLALYLDDCV